MNRHQLFDRFEAQPDYLKTWVRGLSEAYYFHIVLESKYYAIVQRDGHSWYQGAYSGSTQYAPVEYTLIRKDTKNYWTDRGKIITSVKGRLNPLKRKWLSQLLKDSDNGYGRSL